MIMLQEQAITILTDYASGVDNDYYHNYNETFRSFGVELLADFHIFRIPFMISGGIQSAWKDMNENACIRDSVQY